MEETGQPAGIYIHVPFCEKLCPYCDFAVSIKVDIPHREYTDVVVAELKRRASELRQRRVETIYFGGGTPALLRPDCLAEIRETIEAKFDVDDGAEVTLEANPNQVSAGHLEAWRELGIERLSIGCQSFQPRHLEALRRNHDGEMAKEAAIRALKTMERVSIDLMFAGPSQPMEEWRADLEIMQQLVEEHGLDHVSGYNLTIEPGTAFWIRRKRGTVVTPDHETAADMLDELVEATADVRLRRYEVSNFSAPGAESRHNSAYWSGRPYLGVGVGAHSLAVDAGGAARRRNNPERYDAYIDAGGRPEEIEELEPVDHLAERLFTGARTRFGIDFDGLATQFESGVGRAHLEDIQEVLDDLVERDWMEMNGDVYRPTNRGLNFSDSLAEWLFEAATS